MISAKDVDVKEWVENEFGDYFIADLHKGLFDKHSSESVFDRYYWQYLHYKENGVVIFMGSDSGLIYDYIVKRFANSNVKFFIYDFQYIVDSVKLNEAVFNVNLLPFDQVVHMADFDVIPQSIYKESFYLYRSLSVIEDPLGDYKNIVQECESYIQNFKFSQMALLGYKSFYVASLKNSAYLENPFSMLKNKYDKEKVIILAGGPSLNNLLKKISKFQNSLYIICVARVAHLVAAEGILPDFIVSVDPTEMSYNNSVQALSLSDKCNLICSNHAHPKIVGQWMSDVYYLGDILPWEVNFNPENSYGSGPTVTNTAIKTAIEMGFKEIILAGVDLCHDSKGYTHANGSAEAESGPYTKTDTIQVLNYDNEKVDTTVDFYSAIDSLRMQAFIAKNNGVVIYNLSPKAACVEGISLIDVNYFDQMDFVNAKNSSVNHIDDGAVDTLGFLSLIRDELVNKKELSKKIVNDILELKVDCSSLFQGDIINHEVLESTRCVQTEIDELPSGFDRFLKGFGLRLFYQKGAVDYFDDMDEKEISDYNNAYFQSYYSILSEVVELLDVALDRINGRILEVDSKPDFSLIESYLRKSELFLRYRKVRNIDSISDDCFLSFKNSMIDSFDKDVKQADLKNSLRFKSQCSDIQIVSKAHSLFCLGAIDALGSLRDYSDGNLSDLYVSDYIAGLIFELDGNFDEALIVYQCVVENAKSNEIVLRYTLERVFAVASKYNDTMALQAIECLSLLSPYYLKHFAEALFVTGDYLSAIDKFAEYNSHFPDDVSNLIRLSEVYNSIGHADKAIELLKLALEEFPDRKDIESALQAYEL